MKVCGIELKGNDAILCCLQGDKDQYSIVSADLKKISLKDSVDQESVQQFRTSMESIFVEQSFDKIAIKARATKGRFAGGAVSFKMEALIQSLTFPVEIVHVARIKSTLKSVIDNIPTEEVKAYQKEALLTAAYLLHQ